MKVILDNGKEYEFERGSSENNVFETLIASFNQEPAPVRIDPSVTPQTLMMFDAHGEPIPFERYTDTPFHCAYYVKITNLASYTFFKSRLHDMTDMPRYNPCGMYLSYDSEYDRYETVTSVEYHTLKHQYTVYTKVLDKMGILSDMLDNDSTDPTLDDDYSYCI